MGMNNPAPGKLEGNRADIIGLAHLHPDDEPIFILTKEHDFGASGSAVATKITDSAPCKGEVLGALFILTEAKATSSGDTDEAHCIAKDAAAATKMTGDATLDMSDVVYMNMLGSVVGVAPHATAGNRQFAKGDDLYVYSAADANRNAGIYHAILICKKIA